MFSVTRCLTGVLCFVAVSSLKPMPNSQAHPNFDSSRKRIGSVTQVQNFHSMKMRLRHVRGGHVSDGKNGFELNASSDSTTTDEFDQSIAPGTESVEANGHSGELEKTGDEPERAALKITIDEPERELNGDGNVLKEEEIQDSIVELNGDNSGMKELSTEPVLGRWPCGDELDRRLIKIALPCIANFAINPLVGAVDLFWINRMKNTLAVAGQAAANQIFTSSFWLFSFLPSVTATIVAKEAANGSEEGVQDSVCQALFVGAFIALIGTTVIFTQSERMLGAVLKAGAPAREFASPYLMIRAFAFLPSIISLIGFSSFRGVMDTVTPLKISLFANLLNAILDPILIFNANMGVTGAALATLGAEISSCALFLYSLFKKRMIVASKLFRLPAWKTLSPLIKGGAALQLRNFAMNLTFLAVTRVTQSVDNTGVAAAAHAMAIQTFQLGGIVLLAVSTVAQTVVPNAMVERVDKETGVKTGGILAARATTNRLMSWGLILGIALGALQVALFPFLSKASPLIEVRQAARTPAMYASLYQIINGLVFIGEGVMVGTGSFMQLSLSTLVATSFTLLGLNTLPVRYGLNGVWMSFGIFNCLRLAGVAVHQFRTGPLARRKEVAERA